MNNVMITIRSCTTVVISANLAALLIVYNAIKEHVKFVIKGTRSPYIIDPVNRFVEMV